MASPGGGSWDAPLDCRSGPSGTGWRRAACRIQPALHCSFDAPPWPVQRAGIMGEELDAFDIVGRKLPATWPAQGSLRGPGIDLPPGFKVGVLIGNTQDAHRLVGIVRAVV